MHRCACPAPTSQVMIFGGSSLPTSAWIKCQTVPSRCAARVATSWLWKSARDFSNGIGRVRAQNAQEHHTATSSASLALSFLPLATRKSRHTPSTSGCSGLLPVLGNLHLCLGEGRCSKDHQHRERRRRKRARAVQRLRHGRICERVDANGRANGQVLTTRRRHTLRSVGASPTVWLNTRARQK
jgi:hypothetical protein